MQWKNWKDVIKKEQKEWGNWVIKAWENFIPILFPVGVYILMIRE